MQEKDVHVEELSDDDLLKPPAPAPDNSDSEPIRVGEPEAEPEDEDEDPIEVFSKEDRDTFASLMTIGTRSREFSVLGHVVKMKTPNTDDELRVAQASKEFRETEGFVRSYQAAVLACTLVEVNGEPIFQSLTPVEDPQERFEQTLKKVRQMYPLVVSMLYQKVIEMEQGYADMAHKLGKL